ncbi:hypothetical protein LAY57_22245 [Argonema antarcticum A004/B2]|nr:hypothetical protein [Argonema antarcticum A004/B2]
MKKLSIALVESTLVAFGTGGMAQAAILFNSDTGHYYEFVSEALTWNQAKAASENKSYQGLQGYLTTITSQAEHNFIISNVTKIGAWLGASDAEREGVWKWMTGPEAGTVFWRGGNKATGGRPVNGQYANWDIHAPNNDYLGQSDEDYAHLWYGSKGQWNDAPGFARMSGYVVEYGGMESTSPEPTSVTEPSSMLGLLAFGTFGAASLLKRKQQQKVLNSVVSDR